MLIKIDYKTAMTIIRDREPRGQFYYKHRNIYIGIDNTSGDAWTEEFTNLRSCKKWLRGGMVANAQGHII